MVKKEPIIKLNNVSLDFEILGDLKIKVFDKIELEIFSGEKIGLIGPSGSGKTSFFRLIAGLLRPTKGKIKTNGNTRLIYQIPRINPYLTCEEILEIGLQLSESKNSISELLDIFDLSHFKKHLFVNLSEGQKQRISILLNLISGTEILLADEPYSRLDNENIQGRSGACGSSGQA